VIFPRIGKTVSNGWKTCALALPEWEEGRMVPDRFSKNGTGFGIHDAGSE
jgi:hypothetical protein